MYQAKYLDQVAFDVKEAKEWYKNQQEAFWSCRINIPELYLF